MSFDWQTFALETLLWTGALIALVLLLRRPVTRYFGSQAAYALWALPFLRLLFPPVVLPAWFAPAASSVPTPTPAVPLPVGEYTLAEVGGGPVLMQPMVAAPAPIDWLLLGLAAWLIGTIAFLALRFGGYFAMRRELLAASTPVETRGNVRLVETPATHSPVAFGVFDKIVALPIGFMAETEQTRRDLALAHELEHHRAHDLLANALMQPLFAMHWFNPLGWVGWRAMRRDQEAACDARVVAYCDEEQRSTYASTIAFFATGPGNGARLGLAAPMACPVLGDKSIIQRLRSLTMSDISPRRRIGARILMVGALAALPLTASISYAEALSAPPAPDAPSAPKPPAAPAAPTAPDAPTAPAAPTLLQVTTATDVDHDVYVLTEGEDGDEAKRVVRVERKVVRDGSGKESEETSYTVNGREATAEERAKIDAELKKARKGIAHADKVRREVRIMRDKKGDDSEVHDDINVWRERHAMDGDLRKHLEELRIKMGENGEFHKEMRIALANANAELREFKFDCDGSERMVQERTETDGKKVMVICRTAGLASAKSAIAEARRAVESDRNLSSRERSEALRSLDKAMKDIESAN